jgi:hypothetical protein
MSVDHRGFSTMGQEVEALQDIAWSSTISAQATTKAHNAGLGAGH